MMIQLLPRSDFSFNAEAMNQFLKTLAGRKRGFFEKIKIPYEFSFIIDCNKEGKFNFYLSLNSNQSESIILQSLQSVLQEKGNAFVIAEELATHTQFQTLYTKDENEHGKRKKLVEYAMSNSPFEFLLSQMQPNVRVTFEFNVIKDFIAEEKRFRMGASEAKMEGILFVSGKTKHQRNHMTHLSNSFIANLSSEKGLFVKYKKDFIPSIIYSNELWSFFQIPTLERKEVNDFYRRINKLSVGQTTLKKHEFEKGIKVGTLYHPTDQREVYVSEQQLRKHMFITGQTGAGKSSVAEEMMNDLIDKKIEAIAKNEKSPGFTFFDPAETAVLGVIDMILKRKFEGKDISKLIEKVHYIDLSATDYIFPIALLNKDMEATEVVDFFKMVFGDENTKQVDRLVSSAINALLKDKQEHTIQDILRIFSDENFRLQLALRLEKNIYAFEEVSFLRGRFTQTQADPIYNRLDPLRNSNHKKLMFGMTSQFDQLKNLKKWMDDGDIVLFNLKGLTNFDIKFIVGYIMLNYYTQGLTRPQGAMLHLIFIDETHKVDVPIFDKILAEMRKYGVAVCPMTQFLEQLPDTLLKALLGNAGTKATLRLGDASARRIIPNLSGAKVDVQTIGSLSDRKAILTTEDNSEIKTIMIEVNPPYRYTEGKLVDYRDAKAMEENAEKNRVFALELMKRDCMSKKEAEEIVFAELLKENQQLQIEEERLVVGDQF